MGRQRPNPIEDDGLMFDCVTVAGVFGQRRREIRRLMIQLQQVQENRELIRQIRKALKHGKERGEDDRGFAQEVSGTDDSC